jgi:hypothetical protein
MERETRLPYRQGDVALIVAAVPPKANVRDRGRSVLARGEQTGHHHVLEGDCEVLTLVGAGTFARVGPAGATLSHDEHGAIAVPEGEYLVRRQREWAPRAPVRVAD